MQQPLQMHPLKSGLLYVVDTNRREYDYSGKFDSGRTTVVLDKSASFKASSREDSVYQNFAPLEELVNAVTESVIMPSGKHVVQYVVQATGIVQQHSTQHGCSHVCSRTEVIAGCN